MNILLTSVGRRTYMINYFKDALKGKGLVHAANSEETYSLKTADKYVITPLIYNEGYISFVLEYCLNNDITAIVSLFDIDLPVLSQNKALFAEHGISVIVSDIDFVQVCNDKWLTYKFLLKNNFYTPATYLSIGDALQSIHNKLLNYPLIIKPRWGMGSMGIFEADNEEELCVLYKKAQNTINKSYLKYESQQAPNESIVIQEKLQGDEYGLDIFNNLNGEYLTSVPKKKLAMRAGETDSAKIIDNSKLSEIAIKLSQVSRHIGNLDVDCFLVNGEFYILEMNCRFGGQYPFSHLAGVNFPLLLLKLITTKRIYPSELQANINLIGVKDLEPKIFVE